MRFQCVATAASRQNRGLRPHTNTLGQATASSLGVTLAVLGMSLKFFHLGVENWTQEISISLSVSDTVVIAAL